MRRPAPGRASLPPGPLQQRPALRASRTKVQWSCPSPHRQCLRMEKLKRKKYEKELERLQGELVKLQQWVVHKGLKVCVVFEGRDGAGKGGTIKAITERTSPRVFRVVALPAPGARELTQMYMQRYVPHFPAAGEIVIFDRSWYNRAGVERAMVESGILLLKYWLEVSPEEQTRRLEGRINDPRKVWKLSPMDLKSYSRWYDYSRCLLYTSPS